MIIKPSSELRNNFTGISKIVHEEKQPVFLTRNGTGDMVVMSMEYFNENFAMRELFESLDRSEADIKAGRLRDAEEVWAGVDAVIETHRE